VEPFIVKLPSALSTQAQVVSVVNGIIPIAYPICW
jgi:hypothetical protein